MTGTALILGSNGRFGRNMAEALWNNGWQVNLFDRSTDDLNQAARGKDVIVNAWNPVYTDWKRQLPGLTDRVIEAAQQSGATVLIPGNVYVFGENAPELFGPNTPHRATNPLGRLRVDMENAYRDAGVRTIVLRAGDFLDTAATGNWFDKIIAPSLSKGVLTYPGPLDRNHSWAFLPDMARAAVGLLNMRDQLPEFSDIPFPGFTMTGLEMAALCSEALGKPVRAKEMNWLPLQIAKPFWPMGRSLIEMRYLWSKPHFLSDDTLKSLLPSFDFTPAVDALSQAIEPVLTGRPHQPKSNDVVRQPQPAE